MSWNVDSVRIFVQDESQDDKQIIARLQPLADNTVLHIFGYEDPVIKLSAIVVGTGDATLLRTFAKDGIRHSVGYPDFGFINLLYVNSVSTKRTKSIFQTIRPDLPCESPVFTVDLELYQ